MRNTTTRKIFDLGDVGKLTVTSARFAENWHRVFNKERAVDESYDEFVERMWMSGTHPFKEEIAISTLGLSGEAAETLEKILAGALTCVAAGKVGERHKKMIRGDGITERHKYEIVKELGDQLFYITKTANLYGFTLGDVIQGNIEKLTDRRKRTGTMRGSGDNR